MKSYATEYGLITILAVILTSGCTTHVRPPDLPVTKTKTLSSDALEDLIWRSSLLDHLQSWRGTRHVFGGETRRGIDCSAYTRQVYRDLFNIELPRHSGEQNKIGRKIRKSELRTGDLVFFAQKGRIDHVGVYLGDSTFMHVSSRKGVARSRLDTGYWKPYFVSGRRVLDCRSC